MSNIWSLFDAWRRRMFVFFFIWLGMSSIGLKATVPDSVDILSTTQFGNSKYRAVWSRLIPTYLKIQYAGGMGLCNVGVGWSYGKVEQWETDLFLGFIPRYSSDEGKITFTLKQNYIPFRVPINQRLRVDPLTLSLYLNTVFNDEFWTQEPKRYPRGYYGFSTRVRTHIAIGQRLRVQCSHTQRHLAKSLVFFYELSTCDLYLISAVSNDLRPRDFLRLSFGIKIDVL